MGRKTTNPAPVNEDADLEQIMDELGEVDKPSDVEVISDMLKSYDRARKRRVFIEGTKTVLIALILGLLVGAWIGSTNQRVQDQTLADTIRKN